MKRMVLVSLVLALLMAVFCPALAETVKTPASDGSMNVRKGPGVGYEVVTWVKNGESVTVLESGKSWTKIKVDKSGKVGYIKTSALSSDSAAPAPADKSHTLGSVATKYATSNVNVRKGPGTKYEALFSISRNAKLEILGEEGNWFLVRTETGKTGYISKNYVSGGIRKSTTANVHLRADASSKRASLTVLSKGTKVTATSVTGNWTKILLNGQIGYVYSKYLK